MTKFYADGSGWNGECSKFCVVREDEKGSEILIKRISHSKHTNNEMEYRAVLFAIEHCENGDIIYTDSQLVVNQVHGLWKINYAHLQKFVDEIKAVWKKKPDVEIVWVSREQNLAGKVLENECQNTRSKTNRM